MMEQQRGAENGSSEKTDAIPSLIASAIYVPFEGIPDSDSQPFTTRDEKLITLIANLEKHHEAVRQNMLFLFAAEKARIFKEAEDSIDKHLLETPCRDHYHDGAWHDAREWERQNGKAWKNVAVTEGPSILTRMKSNPAPGANLKDYQMKPGGQALLEELSDNLVAEGGVRVGGQAPINGVSGGTVIDNIREETARKLRELVVKSAAELQAYDIRAEDIIKYYQSALDRGRKQDWGAPPPQRPSPPERTMSGSSTQSPYLVFAVLSSRSDNRAPGGHPAGLIRDSHRL